MDGDRFHTSLCETLEGLPVVTFVMFFFAGVVALVCLGTVFKKEKRKLCFDFTDQL